MWVPIVLFFAMFFVHLIFLVLGNLAFGVICGLISIIVGLVVLIEGVNWE